jgi:dynein assembly factor with WDR repeat domains 1
VCFNLIVRTDIDRLIDQILLEEPLISESRKPALKKLIESKHQQCNSVKSSLRSRWKTRTRNSNALKSCALICSHSLIAPSTSPAISKVLVNHTHRFITGSYDRTCKVWDTISGQELLSLEEHKNVVYTMAFNNPYG